MLNAACACAYFVMAILLNIIEKFLQSSSQKKLSCTAVMQPQASSLTGKAILWCAGQAAMCSLVLAREAFLFSDLENRGSY